MSWQNTKPLSWQNIPGSGWCFSFLCFQQRPYDYGIPMEVEVTYVQDGFLTNDVLHEMVWISLEYCIISGKFIHIYAVYPQ